MSPLTDSTAQPSPPDDRPVLDTGPVMLRWANHDGHRAFTALALVGAPVAALLALFGLPPVDVHGPLHYLGIMGPTCGVTRGVMWFTRGDFATAWAYNPVSLLMVPGAAVMLARGLHGRVTGRWLNLSVRRRRWMIVVGVAAVAALTARQQLHVDLLA